MDSLQDFFKEFKNRITNPIFFSFIFAWLLWNWEVTVGFLMYNQETLKNYGYYNYSSLIIINASWNYYLIHPLISAIVYTFGFPPLRVEIIAFLTKYKKKGENKNIEIMGDANVPMQRFLKEKKRTDKLSQELMGIYKEDKVIQDFNIKLEKALNEEQNKLAVQKAENLEIKEENNLNLIAKQELTYTVNSLNEMVNKYSRQFDQAIINGIWVVEFKSTKVPSVENFAGEVKTEVLTINIRDGMFYIKTQHEKEILWAYILTYNYSYYEKTVNLTLRISPDRDIEYDVRSSIVYCQILTIVSHTENGHINEMIGLDSDNVSLKYKLINI